jgi:O-antigen/teichoic acid export membrane protein
VAPTLVAVVLSKAWQGTAPMISTLAGLSLALPVSSLLATYLTAARRTGLQMLLSFLRASLVLGLLAGVGWMGPLWACAAVLLGFVLGAVAALVLVRLATGIPMRDSVGALLPSLAAGVLMVAAVLGVRALAAEFQLTAGWILLTAEVGTGALVYVSSGLLLARSTVRDLAIVVRDAVAQRLRESNEVGSDD